MDEIDNKDFMTVLDEIRKRPTLYLPRYSIFDLQAFYWGYAFYRAYKDGALDLNKHKEAERTGEQREFEDFLNWIEERSPVKTDIFSWASLLYVYSNDERNALDRFFQLLDEYRQVKADTPDVIEDIRRRRRLRNIS
jgi:hypothetical protein